MVRSLRNAEISDLLDSDVVARLATIDLDGYPHVTPIWFLWAADAFYLTSYADRPHLKRIRTNPRVGLVVDVEDELRADGQRPNRQVRVTGDATLSVDISGVWTQRIRRKYVDHTAAPGAAERSSGRERVLITVRAHATSPLSQASDCSSNPPAKALTKKIGTPPPGGERAADQPEAVTDTRAEWKQQ